VVFYAGFKLVRTYSAITSKTYFLTASCGEAGKGGGIKEVAAAATAFPSPPFFRMNPVGKAVAAATRTPRYSCCVRSLINIKFIRNLQPVDSKAHNGFEKW